MVALNCLQLARALALATLVVGFAPVPSFAGSQIVCQRNEERCDNNCRTHLPPPNLVSQCYFRCQDIHRICINTPPTSGMNSGTSKAFPGSK